MNAINPRMHYSAKQPGTHIAWDYLFTSEKEMRGSEFYRWLAKQNLKYFIGGRLQDNGTQSVFSSVEFALDQRHPGKRQIENFSRLGRHITNALAVAKLRANSPFAGACEGLLLDRTASAAFMLDRSGRVIFMNATADAMAASADFATIAEERLTFLGGEYQSSFERELGALLNLAHTGDIAPGAILPMHGGVGDDQFIVRIIPSPRPIVAPRGDLMAACVIVDGPPRATNSLDEELRRVYRLTQREAELARHLWESGSVPIATGAMGISVNTGRVHLQHVFAKLGVRSQNELIKRIDQFLRWH
jgi:DNA-binding CsgD family transcriptional regulator